MLSAGGGLKERTKAQGTKKKSTNKKDFAIFVEGSSAPTFTPFADAPGGGKWQGIGTGKERNKENKKGAKSFKPSSAPAQVKLRAAPARLRPSTTQSTVLSPPCAGPATS